MNSEDEISSYVNVYFNRSFDIKNQIKNFEFPNLVKFLVQWRKNDISKEDPLFRKWLTCIAPSCVYKQTLNTNDTNEKMFVCYFCEAKGFIRSATLIRHYKENHFEMIPKGIFGENVIFKCVECNLDFTRKEYLTVHKQSEKHLKKVDPEGLLIKKRNNESNEESDNFYQKTKIFKATLKTTEITNDDEKSNAGTSSALNQKAICDKSIPRPISDVLENIGLLDNEDDNDADKDSNESTILLDSSGHINEHITKDIKGFDKEYPSDNESNKVYQTEITTAKTISEKLFAENEIQNTQPIDQPLTSTQNDALEPETILLQRATSLKNTERSANKLVKVLSFNLENNLKL